VALAGVLTWATPLLAAGSVAAAGRLSFGRRLLFASAAATWLAVVLLASALGGEAWEYDYVADHARSGTSAPERIGGLWAGPEGSLLFWTALVATAASLAAGHRAANPWTVRLAGLCVVAYGLVVALEANPFGRSDLPAVGGLGLQPVLEHPAMLWHPPLLYGGLTALLYPAILTAGARIRSEAAPAVPGAIAAALAVLGTGLITGARWAHAEVGWGGYWAWDPIETSGLVAFCAGVAALHRGIRHPIVWVLPGVAAIWATTLTRVGLIESVHAFADRPGLRVALLTTAFVLTAALVAPTLRRPGVRLAHPSAGRVIATMTLLALTVVAATGTYQPLVEAATTGDRVAIAGRYFSATTWPVIMVGLLGLVWFDQLRRGSLVTVGATFAGAVAALLVVPVGAGVYGQLLGAAGGAVVVSSVTAGRRDWSRVLAHAGIGILLVGVASTFATERASAAIAVGETQQVAGVQLRHVGVELTEGATPAATATVVVDGVTVRPALVSYPLRGTSTSEIAHVVSGFDEIQVILLDATDTVGQYRVHRMPGVMLVWVGGAVTAIGLVGHSLRRLRARSWSSVDGGVAEPASSAAPGAVVPAGTVGGAVDGTVGGLAGGLPGGADGTTSGGVDDATG
jgi:cytochrome c-type biogenesis protein CcmF